jgi:hypothetical protein
MRNAIAGLGDSSERGSERGERRGS